MEALGFDEAAEATLQQAHAVAKATHDGLARVRWIYVYIDICICRVRNSDRDRYVYIDRCMYM